MKHNFSYEKLVCFEFILGSRLNAAQTEDSTSSLP